MKNISIMSFNLWCGGVTEERCARVCAAIRESAPDILGVQEATPQWMNILRNALPEYASAGIGREGGDKGEYSAIFVKKERFDILAEDTRWLTETPEVFSYVEGSLCPRVYTWANLYDKANNTELYHINTHLDHGPEEVRMVQAHFLYDFIEGLDAPVSVTGDFNYDERTSEVYKYFTAGVLADSKYLAKDRYAAPTFHGYKNIDAIIDFCYVTRDAYDVEDYRVIDRLFDGEHPSDHNPVVVTICKK